MKRLASVLLVVCLLFGLCSCGGGSESSASFEAKVSESEAHRLFMSELIDTVEDYFKTGGYYDLSKFEYECSSIELVGTEYEISGSYDTYWSWGDYAKTVGFSGTVNAVSGAVYVKSIFNAA